MDPSLLAAVASIIVGGVAAIAGIAAQRSAANASVKSTEISTQAAALDNAYERARKFDLETIARQDIEIDELRSTNTSQSHQIRKLRDNDRKQSKEIRELNELNEELGAEVMALRLQVTALKSK